jgi:hypothetical protein
MLSQAISQLTQASKLLAIPQGASEWIFIPKSLERNLVASTRQHILVKRKWVSPKVNTIGLQAAQQWNGISTDSHHTGSRVN